MPEVLGNEHEAKKDSISIFIWATYKCGCSRIDFVLAELEAAGRSIFI